MVKDVEMRDGSAGSCGKSKEIVEAQRTYYMEGKTRALSARIDALSRLEQSILTYEQELYQALRSDLGKSRAESYMCEVGLTLSELRYVRRHVKSWSRNRRVHTPLAQFHAASFTVQEPYGVVLIMSPWNYPMLLTLEPLIGVLAAGNCCVLKPSAYSPATSAVMAKLIREAFPSDYVTVIEGGRKENEDLLNQKFDYIFFTGGKTGHGEGKCPPDSGDAGAGRQESLHRGSYREHSADCQTAGIWKIFELWTDLCGTGLCAGGKVGEGEASDLYQGRDQKDVWRASLRKPGLWKDDQSEAF